MDYGKDKIKKQIRELINQGHIEPENIPTIDLYMEQITTFMDRYLSGYKRNEDDKTLTKTMINNYTKNDLLPPPNKKKYGMEHIIILIYIYYFKNVISISDIQTILKPLVEDCEEEVRDFDLAEIYEKLYKLELRQYFNTEKSIINTCELAYGSEENKSDKDEYIKNFMFLSLLGYDVFMKKKLMEHIIDDMAREQEAKCDSGKNKKQ